ncbi:CU044_5270 family protein [Nonomuraea sp. NPDC050786]|uniref:CU044_5270 family protein n=1 Tax=Nonomuraea sp. NPDC050786 TaxID=3154840 RepID=UPI0033FA8DB1
MNDLEELAALLAKPEPSAETAARSRSRLHGRTRGRARRRIGWLAPATALAAAAAVTAVVVSTGATTTGGTVAVTATTAGASASAREILLVAAASAARTPQGSGTYWHVKREWLNMDVPPIESWTGRDGKRWSKNQPEDPPGAVVRDQASWFMLKGAKASFEDLESLPTDPEALKAWIAERKGRESDMSLSEQRDEPVYPLIALITELPVPSKVRSAAFQALAALPGVQNAGAVEGGQELRISDPDGHREIKLVIDPETSRVTRTNLLLGDDGSLGMSKGLISVTTDWTDQVPQ